MAFGARSELTRALYLCGEPIAVGKTGQLLREAGIDFEGWLSLPNPGDAASSARHLEARLAANPDRYNGVQWMPCFSEAADFIRFHDAVRASDVLAGLRLLHPAWLLRWNPAAKASGILFTGFWSSGNTIQGVLLDQLWRQREAQTRPTPAVLQCRQLAQQFQECLRIFQERAFVDSGLTDLRIRSHEHFWLGSLYGFDGNHGVVVGPFEHRRPFCGEFLSGHFCEEDVSADSLQALGLEPWLALRHPLDVLCSLAAKTTFESDRLPNPPDRLKLRQARLSSVDWFQAQCRRLADYLAGFAHQNAAWNLARFEALNANPERWIFAAARRLGSDCSVAGARELWNRFGSRPLYPAWQSHHTPQAQRRSWQGLLTEAHLDCAREHGLESMACTLGYGAFKETPLQPMCEAPKLGEATPADRAQMEQVDLDKRSVPIRVGNRSLRLEFWGGGPRPLLEKRLRTPERWRFIGLLDPDFDMAAAPVELRANSRPTQSVQESASNPSSV
ncbi:MAG: hypothetical protein ACFBZ8_03435 [Opitutales bacterium]